MADFLLSSRWVVLGGLVVLLFAIDLIVIPKFFRERGLRRSVVESVGWIAVALGFTGYIAVLYDGRVIEYLSAYAIEKTLSADNLFVFAVTFEYFRIRPEHQRRVLMFGIIGAAVLRLVFIMAGIALLEAMAWIAYVFGGLLIATGARIGLRALRRRDDETTKEPAAVRLAARLLPVDRKHRGREFWYRSTSGVCLTPMFLALLAIESADVMFAIDSVPAVLAVTRDRYIAYASNLFAILGLRALYFVLSGVMHELPLIKPALAAILVFVGIKMIAGEFVEWPVWLPLLVTLGILGAAVAGSISMRGGGRMSRKHA